MAQKDSCTVGVLELLKLILEPSKNTSWVLVHGENFPVVSIAEVSIEREDLGVSIGTKFGSILSLQRD